MIETDDVEQSWEVSFAEHVAGALGLTAEETHRIRGSVVSGQR